MENRANQKKKSSDFTARMIALKAEKRAKQVEHLDGQATNKKSGHLQPDKMEADQLESAEIEIEEPEAEDEMRLSTSHSTGSRPVSRLKSSSRSR